MVLAVDSSVHHIMMRFVIVRSHWLSLISFMVLSYWINIGSLLLLSLASRQFKLVMLVLLSVTGQAAHNCIYMLLPVTTLSVADLSKSITYLVDCPSCLSTVLYWYVVCLKNDVLKLKIHKTRYCDRTGASCAALYLSLVSTAKHCTCSASVKIQQSIWKISCT